MLYFRLIFFLIDDNRLSLRLEKDRGAVSSIIMPVVSVVVKLPVIADVSDRPVKVTQKFSLELEATLIAP